MKSVDQLSVKIFADGADLAGMTALYRQPFIKGFTLFFWAAGTWWIPLLFILGFWRHVYKRFPLRYDPQYWGMVFPLGMYTVCTFQLSKAIAFEPLMIIPRYFVFVAFAAWLAAFIGLIWSLLPQRATAAAPVRNI